MRAALAMSWILALALVISGCSSNDETTTPATDGTTAATADGSVATGDAQNTQGDPTAEFKDLKQYDGIQGTVTIDLTTTGSVTQVELLADGTAVATATEAPFALTWDSTSATDGIVQLSLSVNGAAASSEIPVVVYNNGEEATWLNGNSGTMTIVADADNHLPFHWTMPDGIRQIIGVLFWDNARFQMRLDVGTGTCPHSGQLAATSDPEDGKSSPVVTVFPDAKSGTLTSDIQWFAHAACDNEADLVDKETNLHVQVYLLR